MAPGPERGERGPFPPSLRMDHNLLSPSVLPPPPPPQVVELYRLVAVAMSLWNQFAVPLLFSVFWMVLFVVQLGSDVMAARGTVTYQGLLFLLLSRCVCVCVCVCGCGCGNNACR